MALSRHVIDFFLSCRYFLEEIQLGETLIGRGDFENGVDHLANAIVVCGQPTRLLQVLQSSLPAQVFGMLIQKMQDFSKRAEAEGGPRIVAVSSSLPVQAENDVDMSINEVIDDLE